MTFTPLFRPTVAVLLVLLAMAGSARMATAQTTVGSAATTDATASTGDVKNNGVVTFNQAAPSPFTASHGKIDYDFKTNQASTPGTIVGSTAHANGGCPAVDGWQLGTAPFNFGKTTAQELVGCMINQFKDRLAGYEGKEVDGRMVWAWQTKLKLEADCKFPLYREILETSGVYECNETRKQRQANAPLQPLAPARVSQRPMPWQAGG